jgi:hypothetical protein
MCNRHEKPSDVSTSRNGILCRFHQIIDDRVLALYCPNRSLNASLEPVREFGDPPYISLLPAEAILPSSHRSMFET